MHSGVAAHIYAQRDDVLQAAYALHPNRFKMRRPQRTALPVEAWINMPKTVSAEAYPAKVAH